MTRSRHGARRPGPYTCSGARAPPGAEGPLRVRRVPPRPGARGPGGARGPRHARIDADGRGQVADLPARRDAPPHAHARPLPADRADEGPGRQAAGSRRLGGDVRELLARTGRGGGSSPCGRSRRDTDPLRGAGAASPGVVRHDAPRDRRWARRRRRGALRQHVGARLPARLPLHPPRARGARPPCRAGDDRDGDAVGCGGDRRGARAGARARADDRAPPEPPLRRRASGNGEERLRALLARLVEPRRAPRRSSTRARVDRARRSPARCAVTASRREHYHAGLEPDERTQAQDAFVAGRVPVVVATTAFGMGIDKPDVRLVALVNYPDSLEGYVQMVGRAGRDGAPSDTVLFVGDADASVPAALLAPRGADAGRPAPRLPRGPRCGRQGRPGRVGRRRSATSTTHAFWSGCSSRPVSGAAATTWAGRCAIELHPPAGDAGEVVDRMLTRYASRSRGPRRADRLVRGRRTLPPPTGAGALRRGARRPLRCVRRLRSTRLARPVRPVVPDLPTTRQGPSSTPSPG